MHLYKLPLTDTDSGLRGEIWQDPSVFGRYWFKNEKYKIQGECENIIYKQCD